MHIFSALTSGAVAAVVMAGSAMAGVVDNFNQSSTAVAGASSANVSQGGSWYGGFFNSRTTTATRGVGGTTPAGGVATTCSSTTGGGSWAASFTGDRPNTIVPSYAGVSYGSANVGGAAIDFDKIMIDVAFTGTSRNAGSYIRFDFVSSNGGTSFAAATLSGAQLTASSLHVEFSKSAFVENLDEGAGPVDWSNVTALVVGMSSAGATGSGQTWTVTNFQMTAVPAPGAVALLGAAGLVGGRRRRA